MSAVLDLGVYPVAGERGRYYVKGSGRSAALYLVDLDDCSDGGCGCRDYEVRSGMMLHAAPDCKHLRRARMYLGLQQQFMRVRI